MIGMPAEYITYKQAEAEGGHIKKGARSRMVFFFKMLQKERTGKDGLPKYNAMGEAIIDEIPCLQYFRVFCMEDTEGIESKYVTIKPEPHEHVPIEQIEAAVADYLERSGVTLRHYAQNKSYYGSARDEIVLPHPGQFDSPEHYYAALFHEMGHSTGVEKRLNRDMSGDFASEEYSREELVAEMVSAVLCNHFGIDTGKVFKNSAAYIQHWLKALRGDKRMIAIAASRAEKAVRLILNQTSTDESVA
jgi:antirestriction protein ArdC